MNLLNSVPPIEKGYQILFKTIAVGMNENRTKVLEVLSCKKNIKIDFITEEDNPVDKNAIAIYMSGIKKYFIFFEEKINNKVGYIKKEIAADLYKYNLFDNIIFRATALYLDKNEHISFYFDILIKDNKFQELMINKDFIENYTKDMTRTNEKELTTPNINQFKRVTILSEQKKKPLSRETLKNINENREYNYSRTKNTFFDLPIHNKNYESDFDDEDDDFIFTKVAGVSHKNDDGVERQEILKYCYEGESLFLERDIYNEYSKYAIKVCRKCNDEQIGYLSDSLAKKLKYREIEKFIVVIKNITGGTVSKPSLGCNIKITFTA